jgi:hypothetical protein
MAEHFASSRYLDESRWASYWHQIACVLDNAKGGRLLEVGVGNGIVAAALRMRFDVTTLDVDPDLAPDVVGDVRDADRLLRKPFDVVLCAEVLEHLPFGDFLPVLKKLRALTGTVLVVSLPHPGPSFSLALKAPLLPRSAFAVKVPWPTPLRAGGPHQWEVGKRGYPLSRVAGAMREAGFDIARTYIVPASPIHRMFVLRPSG